MPESIEIEPSAPRYETAISISSVPSAQNTTAEARYADSYLQMIFDNESCQNGAQGAAPWESQIPPPAYSTIQQNSQTDSVFTPYPADIVCPHCQDLVRTTVEYHSDSKSSCVECLEAFYYTLLVVLVALFIVLICFAVLTGGGSGSNFGSCGPHGSDSRKPNADNCSKATHTCPRCNNVIGIFERTRYESNRGATSQHLRRV